MFWQGRGGGASVVVGVKGEASGNRRDGGRNDLSLKTANNGVVGSPFADDAADGERVTRSSMVWRNRGDAGWSEGIVTGKTELASR